MRVCRSVQSDGLAQRAGEAIEDQDAVVFGHDRIPVVALSKGGCAGPIGQGDGVRQGWPTGTKSRDKQAQHDYEPCDHGDSQYSDQPPQKFQICRLGQGRFRSIGHGLQPVACDNRSGTAAAP